MKIKNRFFPIIILLAGAFILLQRTEKAAIAQSDELFWQEPVNISQSGAGTAPTFFIDAQGFAHVVWEDEFQGVVYLNNIPEIVPDPTATAVPTASDEEDAPTATAVPPTATPDPDAGIWNQPQPIRVPFTDPPFDTPLSDDFSGFFNPQFAVDSNDIAHAVWLNGDNELIYSRVAVENFTSPAAWTAPRTLAPSALVHDIVVGLNGRLHLTILRPAENEDGPAGIYYRQSNDGGVTWSDAVAIYVSSYFRTIDTRDAHLKLAAITGTPIEIPPDPTPTPAADAAAETATVDPVSVTPEYVHVAWDNRLLDSVFTTHSADGGLTWAEPTLIDTRNPEDSEEATGPTAINIQPVNENEVHVSWWAGHQDDALQCSLFHRVSLDGGSSWSDRIELLEDNRSCPTSSNFLVSQGGLLFLLVEWENDLILQAWDSSGWSDTEEQEPLSRFISPETFRELSFDCRQYAVTAGNYLLVVGCSSSAINESRDIWSMRRPLGEIEDWFSRFDPTPVWTAPENLLNSSTNLLHPEVVVGADGRIHAMWSETDSVVSPGRIPQPEGEIGSDILYMRLNQAQWSAPRPVLRSPEGYASQLSVTASRDGNLFAAWNSGQGFYFSRVSAEGAVSAAEWIDPISLPISESLITWPHLIVNEAGDLYLSYTVPLNDKRGIYLLRSTDNGNTWSDPSLIFDGAAAGWVAVGATQMSFTRNGNLFLAWSQNSSSAIDDGVGLMFARSADGGVTWSEPQSIAEGIISWFDLLGVGERTVHLAWLSTSNSNVSIRHQVSFDRGLTWSEAMRVSDPVVQSGPTAFVVDDARQVHLVHLAETSTALLQVQEWIWNGEMWEQNESLNLGAAPVAADSLHAMALSNGRLGVFYATLLQDTESELLEDNFFYTSRELFLQGVTVTPLPTLTATPLPPPTETPVPPPSPTPTRILPTPLPDGQGANGADGLLFGILPAAFIVIVIFVIGLRYTRGN